MKRKDDVLRVAEPCLKPPHDLWPICVPFSADRPNALPGALPTIARPSLPARVRNFDARLKQGPCEIAALKPAQHQLAGVHARDRTGTGTWHCPLTRGVSRVPSGTPQIRCSDVGTWAGIPPSTIPSRTAAWSEGARLVPAVSAIHTTVARAASSAPAMSPAGSENSGRASIWLTVFTAAASPAVAAATPSASIRVGPPNARRARPRVAVSRASVTVTPHPDRDPVCGMPERERRSRRRAGE